MIDIHVRSLLGRALGIKVCVGGGLVEGWSIRQRVDLSCNDAQRPQPITKGDLELG